MNPNNFKVIRQNGETYDLEEIGLIVMMFVIDSPTPINNFEKINSRDGFIDLGTTYSGRSMRAKIAIKSDFSILKDKLFKVFESKEFFYIVPDEDPNIRYRVKCVDKFSLRRSEGETDIEFISPSAYAESIGTTLSPPVGQMIQVKESDFNAPAIQYSFKSDSFSVWNDGDVTIDPRIYPLTITFVGDSTNPLTIENLTTSELWSYTGITTINDTIKLDGIKSIKNNASIFRNTNRKLLTLKEGWNEFKVTGSTNFSISFDFRFYYL